MSIHSAALDRVHIVGLAGSGKTTLAVWFAERFGLEAHDLDWVAYSEHRATPLPEVERRIAQIMSGGRWVTEGAYGDSWITPLLGAANLVVWLDVSVATCLARMLKRHVRAEMARRNQHPGWVRLVRFMNYTRESANDQRRRTEEMLEPHTHKVRRCMSAREVRSLQASLHGE